MNPRPLLVLFLLHGLSACESDPGTSSASTTSSTPPASVDAVEDAAPAPVDLQLRRLNKIPDAVDAKDPAAAWGWRDANGENVFVVTYADHEGAESEYETSRSRSMVITHDVLGSDGSVVRKRTVKDYVNDCPFDVHLQLEDDSLQTSDLDGDGLAEITFAYLLTCTSDVSPYTRKLLLLEDGEKYILRGHAGVDFLQPPIPSEYELDPSVASGPRVFREHLIAAWGPSASKGQ